MKWWTTSSPNTSLRRGSAVLALATLLPLGSLPLPAQESTDQLYKRAIELFNKPDVEGACELLKQIQQESPGYKDIRTYLNPACAATKLLYSKEEQLFNAAVQDFNQEHYDDASQKFEQAGKLVLKHPKYREQISRYLKEIDSRAGEQRKFKHCADLYNQQKYSASQTCFTEVVQAGGPRASAARDFLGKIAEAVSKRRVSEEEAARVLNNGNKLLQEGKYGEARVIFNQLVRKGGPEASQARSRLAQIDEGERRLFNEAVRLSREGKDAEARVRLKQIAEGGGPQAGEARSLLAQLSNEPMKPAGRAPAPTEEANEPMLRAGLEAYFSGRFDEAERHLSDYLRNNGRKEGLCYFFRGASHSALYFLSGEKDSLQKAQALADFRTLKQRAAQFRLPQKYMSPKILAVYTEAVNTPPQ